jgi:N-dimethylarginine dimethylaminohydrolase
MKARLYRSAEELKGFSVKNCPTMPAPASVLMCPPDHYAVSPDHVPSEAQMQKARGEWDGVRSAFESLGRPVKLLDPAPGLPHMTFTATHSLAGVTPRMEKVCLLGQSKRPSRRGEAERLEAWYKAAGYRIEKPRDPALAFEAGADCAWHPGKRLLWGAHGFRTDPEAYEPAAEAFEAPVLLLKLVNERFMHLGTCFRPLTPEAVLIMPSAFDPMSLELILKIFPIVLAADEREAAAMLPCGAAVVDGTAILEAGATAAAGHLHAIGLAIRPVETREFLKAGASAAALAANLY